MIAVRDNEDMAAASTVSPSRVKVIVVRGVGRHRRARGPPAHHAARSRSRPTQAFTPEESLRVVATAVIGGLGSIVGPVIGALVGAWASR